MKKTLLTLSVMAFATLSQAAVSITNFGTSTFALDGFSNFASMTQTASNITIAGSDFGASLIGGVSPVSIIGNSSSLTLTGSSSTPLTSPFFITLYDSGGGTATYSGGTWSALSGGAAVLDLSTSSNGFNFGDIIGVQLDASGAPPGTAVNAVLTGLTAGVVPEPTRALLLGVGLMGLMMRRRR